MLVYKLIIIDSYRASTALNPKHHCVKFACNSISFTFLRSYPVPCNIRFRWAIEVYAKTRVRREIIFGLEDLLGKYLFKTEVNKLFSIGTSFPGLILHSLKYKT